MTNLQRFTRWWSKKQTVSKKSDCLRKFMLQRADESKNRLQFRKVNADYSLSRTGAEVSQMIREDV
jgi:hypothetical protein